MQTDIVHDITIHNDNQVHQNTRLTLCRRGHFEGFPGSHSRQNDARDSTEKLNYYK